MTSFAPTTIARTAASQHPSENKVEGESREEQTNPQQAKSKALPKMPTASVQVLVDKSSALNAPGAREDGQKVISAALVMIEADPVMKRLLSDHTLKLEVGIVAQSTLRTVAMQNLATPGRTAQTLDPTQNHTFRAHSYSRRENNQTIQTVLLSDTLFSVDSAPGKVMLRPELLVSLQHELHHVHHDRSGNARMLSQTGREEFVTGTSITGLKAIQEKLSSSGVSGQKVLGQALVPQIASEERDHMNLKKSLR